MVVTDHIGMVSGRKEDKSGIFDVFYGELDTAPMIEQCKVTMELKLIEHIELPTHDLFVGEIVGTYADLDVLTNGIVDIAKLKPLLFDMSSKKYWSLGEPVAKCWSVGKDYAALSRASDPPTRCPRSSPGAASAVVISELTSACDGTLPLITSLPSIARAGVDMTP